MANATFSTSDLSLAAYLSVKEVKFIRLEEDKEIPGKYKFVFNNEDGKAANSAVDYINKAKDISALEYKSALREMRNIIHLHY